MPPDRQFGVQSAQQWIKGRGRPLNVLRLNSSSASQNDWRAGSRG
jgi:hypothetical protein